MTNKSGAKGTDMEGIAVQAFDPFWPGTIRRGKQGVNDKGDLYMPGNDLYVVEVKNCARMDLAGWLREAEREAANAGVSSGLVYHKRRGSRDPLDQYITATARNFFRVAHGWDGGSGGT